MSFQTIQQTTLARENEREREANVQAKPPSYADIIKAETPPPSYNNVFVNEVLELKEIQQRENTNLKKNLI